MNTFLKAITFALLVSNGLYAVKPKSTSDWDRLPNELQVTILEKIKLANTADEALQQLLALRLVNRQWKYYIDNTTTGVAILDKAIGKYYQQPISAQGLNYFNDSFLNKLQKLNIPSVKLWLKDRELANAVYFNNTKRIAELLEPGANPNALNPFDPELSIFAQAVSRNTNKETLENLLLAGADINKVMVIEEYTSEGTSSGKKRSMTALDLALEGEKDIQSWGPERLAGLVNGEQHKANELKQIRENIRYLKSQGAKTAAELGYK